MKNQNIDRTLHNTSINVKKEFSLSKNPLIFNQLKSVLDRNKMQHQNLPAIVDSVSLSNVSVAPIKVFKSEIKQPLRKL